jgi:hypothetical protein
MPQVTLDTYVVDTLMPDLVGHDRAPSAFLVFLFLYRRTIGADVSTVQISLSDVAIGTGLSKRAVQSALSVLARRRLASIRRASITAVPVYALRRPWTR